MAYKICKSCKKMFKDSGKEYCKDCYDKNEEEYKLVIEYIKNNPNNTILDIITETKVPLRTINRFIEEGIVSYKKKANDPE